MIPLSRALLSDWPWHSDRTALDYFGKLHTSVSVNEFLYLAKKKDPNPFHYKNVTYRSVSIPTALKRAKKIDFDVMQLHQEGHVVKITSLERTFVDILDRPNLCGSWEEIWRSFENIEYLNLDKVIEYALLLGNATTIAKVGFCLEDHLEQWMVSENHLKELQKYIPLQPQLRATSQTRASEASI